MCDFHSILGVAIGDTIEIRHDSSNSHSKIAGSLVNQPNRKPIIFEAEWGGDGEQPADSLLIRNRDECPEALVAKIRDHYSLVKKAITTGEHLHTYFRDTKKWSDVWSKAIRDGVQVILPSVFDGDLYLFAWAKLNAPNLTKVGGDLRVYGGAKLNAPKLTSVGGALYVDGAVKLPSLARVFGKLYVDGAVQLPSLARVFGNLYVESLAKLNVPKLARVGGDLRVYGGAKLNAPKLTRVRGYIYVESAAKLKAPKLKRKA